MQPVQLEEAISRILVHEQRFDPGAYFLVRDALDFTVERLAEQNQGESRHVSGAELVIGFRDYLLQEYGPMAGTICRDWGILESRHIGEIVFHFINENVFGKQDSDSIDDFTNVINLDEAFSKPFAPDPSADSTPPVAKRAEKKTPSK